MQIVRIDHIVPTVSDIEKTFAFYSGVLGMRAVTFGDNRKALIFGNQKVNLHQKGQEFEPKASRPTPGSADMCFIAETPVFEIIRDLAAAGITVEAGPFGSCPDEATARIPATVSASRPRNAGHRSHARSRQQYRRHISQ